MIVKRKHKGLGVAGVAIGIIIGLSILTVITTPPTPKKLITYDGWLSDWDNTDDNINKIKSGLHVFIDYGTKCQYLSTINGGLTPRLNNNGKHICDQLIPPK
jgi:hypothetical protein